MAYTSWAFTATQTVGEESTVTITSVTSGTDAAVTQRRVYLQMDSGEFLVPTGVTTDYNQWALADSSIDIDALGDSDKALRIVVEWLDVNDAVLYDSTQYVGLTLYNESFDYSLTQLMTSNAALIGDNNFFPNKELLRTYIDGGNQAMSFANDLYNAQLCYDKATDLRVSSQYYFNGNS